jgi:putative ABC transport system permease protein
MEKGKASRARRFYRLLLRLLPGDFRGDFGEEMEEVFLEQHHEAGRAGGRGLLRLWRDTVAGILTTAPGEHLAMFRQDAGFALRMMRKNLAFTLATVATLALGIGANTAIFSVVHAVLLKPLPYAHGDRIVLLGQQAPAAGLANSTFSVAEMQDYRRENRSLDALVEYHNMSFILLGGKEPERVETGVVSWNFFDVFGVRPLLGRGFVPDDEKEGAPAVLLLGYDYWQRSLGGDPTVVGRNFRMNDKVHTVVGILPPFPQYPDTNDVYMPSVACPFRSNPKLIANRSGRMVRLFGRRKPGVEAAEAQADLSAVAASMQKAFPDAYPRSARISASVRPLREELTHAAKPTMLLLLAAAGFVLVIACASVANLNLARMVRRDRELAIRSAMGAGRVRLFRQLLTESLLLSLAGGALGLLLSGAVMRMLAAFAARFSPRASEIRIDLAVLLFTVVVAFVASLASGSVPALASRESLTGSLKEGGGPATLGFSRGRARSALIVAQFAVSFMLLIGAGLMLRSVLNLQHVDPGFQLENVLTMDIYLNFAKYTDGDKRRGFFESLLERVRAQPQVISAAISLAVPLDLNVQNNGSFRIEGQNLNPAEEPPVADFHVVSPDYFRTLGIPVISGRAFDVKDASQAAPVALLNETLARHRWPGQDPLGRRISFDDGKTWVTVVGIAGDTREAGLDHPAVDGVYLALAQTPLLQGTLVAKTRGDPLDVARAVVQRMYEVDPEQPAGRIRSLESVRADSIAAPRLTAKLLGIFALLALLIAATGIGGVIAITIGQRTHEIGVRMAIGARPTDILGMVLRQGMGLALMGIGMGLLGAFGLARILKGLLFGVAPTDPLTFALVALVLALAAFVACLLPARRAAGVDPMIALRVE